MMHWAETAASLLTIGSVVTTGERPINRWLASWVAPSVLLAVGMIIYSTGVYVGRGPYAILAERMDAHIVRANDGFRETVPRGELMSEMRRLSEQVAAMQVEMDRRLDQIERRLETGR